MQLTTFAAKGIWSMKSDTCAADQAERVRYFNLIAPKPNWKMPIDAWIAEDDLADANEAAVWFTGSTLTIAERAPFKVRVTAPGYYAVIGA